MSADHRRGIFAATHLIYPSVRVEIREPRCHSEQEIGKFWSLLCIGVVWSPWSSTPNRIIEQLFNPCKQTLFCLLQTDRHFLSGRTLKKNLMSWWRFKICSAWQRTLRQEFGCWQDKGKTGTDVHSNPLVSCSSYVLTSVCEEGFVLCWNWVLLGQAEMQEWAGGMRLGVSKLWQSW